MTPAWRIVQTRHAEGAFTGGGARLFGGRWNLAGTAVVYTAGGLALATLEMLVHLHATKAVGGYTVFPLSLPPDLIETVPPANLPDGWYADPPPTAAGEWGTGWVRSARSCILRVPSAVVPEEWNYLLNPAHPRFGEVVVGAARPFVFDPRLIRQ